MPDVRLSGNFAGHKAGEIVRLTNEQLSDADAARVVGKLFPTEYSGATPIRTAAKKTAAKKTAAKKTASPAEGKGRPALEAYGDK